MPRERFAKVELRSIGNDRRPKALFEERLEEFEALFHPKSIAVVGVSSDERKVGSAWVRGLLSADFKGNVYAVGAGGGTIAGSEIFTSLRSIPGEVDYVVVCIPRRSVLSLLDDCAFKKVKFIHLFTAGFSETGDAEGHELEQHVVAKARQSGIRIIGPNCIGVYCPESRFPSGPAQEPRIGIDGSVGFISQSGGLADKLVELGIARGIGFSKGVSFGNGADLDAADFLQYLAADPKTRIIGAYFEGSRDGRRLFDSMKKIAQVKPLVAWKGGKTGVGAEAAMSHTGSLSSSAAIWSTMLKQAGAIEVDSLEELVDVLLLLQQVRDWQGIGVAIVGGLCGGGGGISVSAGDACSDEGLSIPVLSEAARQELVNVLGPVGSIVRNPVDISESHGQPSILHKVMEVIMADANIQLVIVQEDADILMKYGCLQVSDTINGILIDFASRCSKPVVVVSPPGSAEMDRLRIENQLSQASIPVFPTMERAARAIARADQYFSSH